MLLIEINQLITKNRRALLELSFRFKKWHRSKEIREQFLLRTNLLGLTK